MKMCGIVAPRRTGFPTDRDGCVLTEGHDGRHEFITRESRWWWETDYDCACVDCMCEEPDCWCVVYGEVNTAALAAGKDTK